MVKKIFCVMTVCLFFLFSFSFAQEQENIIDHQAEGKPFKEIWAAIKALQDENSELKNVIENIQLTPGPKGDIGSEGPMGEQGPIGAVGLTGLPGINCWDLDSDRVDDAEEDINEDGVFNAYDCQPYDPPEESRENQSIKLSAASGEYLYIEPENQTGLDFSGDFTSEAWIKIDSTPGSQIVFARWINPSHPNGYQFYLGHDGYGNYRIMARYWDNPVDTYIMSDLGVISASDIGVWHHIAISVNVSNHSGSIYLNGLLINDTVIGNGTIINSPDSAFYIGSINGSINFFDGQIDDVRIWNGIRTSQEISDNYQIELTGKEPGLVGYWKFNGDLKDSTSNGNDLTHSTGAPTFITE